MILDYYKIPPEKYNEHLWYVSLTLEVDKSSINTRLKRSYEISHMGETIIKGKGKAFGIQDQ
jgi:hypothetical protein